ncbi:hypothetical protein G9A89_016478 [Geosiphon pyriformis]|nr:hypothetical protein G9A89_016478 [Geosiphon pyriformis]
MGSVLKRNKKSAAGIEAYPSGRAQSFAGTTDSKPAATVTGLIIATYDIFEDQFTCDLHLNNLDEKKLENRIKLPQEATKQLDKIFVKEREPCLSSLRYFEYLCTPDVKYVHEYFKSRKAST